jgi:hypothetical protein
MLRLAKDFYIANIDKSSGYTRDPFAREYEYRFVYKKYKVELTTQFSICGYTKKDNTPIINFGYSINIERFCNRHLYYTYIDDLDRSNGKSTKKYFDSKEAREIVLKFVDRFIDRYLQDVSPCIIIRGAMSQIKTNLPRYKRFDKHFDKYNYKKTTMHISECDDLYSITYNKTVEDKEIWVYTKKRKHIKRLKDIYTI